LSIMKKKNKPLSELAEVMEVFPQVLVNIDVKSKPPIEDQQEIMDAISEVERSLANKGRVLVRYSGTQSMCRVMIEGPTQKETEKYAGLIADVVRDKLG
ncbi:MAG TPA: phosphoglucosamine mutase, partial [Actinobacteria bacterium]|nr:phosphoglucosamine mutase [Actinomycetota bacterium]